MKCTIRNLAALLSATSEERVLYKTLMQFDPPEPRRRLAGNKEYNVVCRRLHAQSCGPPTQDQGPLELSKYPDMALV